MWMLLFFIGMVLLEILALIVLVIAWSWLKRWETLLRLGRAGLFTWRAMIRRDIQFAQAVLEGWDHWSGLGRSLMPWWLKSGFYLLRWAGKIGTIAS